MSILDEGSARESLEALSGKPSAPISASKARPVSAILWGGCIAGALDITYAAVRAGLAGFTPARMLKGIAAGLLGRGAIQGGWEIAALGLALHFSIALGAASVYFAASRKIPLMVNRAGLSGLLFGALVYLFMYRVVLPLSALSIKPPLRVLDLLVHLFFIGLPIALSVRRFSREEETS